MQHNTLAFEAVAASPHNLGNTLIERVSERNVSNHTSLEECERPDALGTVNDLVWDHEVAGLDLLLQAADGREGNDGADTNGAQGRDVGAGRHLMGRNLMVQAVATKESNSNGLFVVRALVVQDRDRGGGSAPRSRDVQGSNLSETREFAETSSTDDGDTDGVYKNDCVSISCSCRGMRGNEPAYVLGREAILSASCLADSILLRGLVMRVARERRSRGNEGIQCNWEFPLAINSEGGVIFSPDWVITPYQFPHVCGSLGSQAPIILL